LEEGDDAADLNEGMSEMDLSDADLNYHEREKKAESGEKDSDQDNSSSDNDESRDSDQSDDYDSDSSDDFIDEDETVSLSEDDGPDLDDYMIDFIEDDPSTYKTRDDGRGGDEEEKSMPLVFENTFHEYLEQQLGMLDLDDEREFAIAQQIIGSIDDDGYMRREPDAMVD
ncbi:MAG: hypothetical protein KDC86_13465, partial [Saprospiraceae bacterium]|nr:hypothetical protein [Saprospiraceae bacterium]